MFLIFMLHNIILQRMSFYTLIKLGVFFSKKHLSLKLLVKYVSFISYNNCAFTWKTNIKGRISNFHEFYLFVFLFFCVSNLQLYGFFENYNNCNCILYVNQLYNINIYNIPKISVNHTLWLLIHIYTHEL